MLSSLRCTIFYRHGGLYEAIPRSEAGVKAVWCSLAEIYVSDDQHSRRGSAARSESEK